MGRGRPGGLLLSASGQKPVRGERGATDRERGGAAAGADQQLAPRRTPQILFAYHWLAVPRHNPE